MTQHVETFHCMGCKVRLVISGPVRTGLPTPAAAAVAARSWLEEYDRRMSPVRLLSETTALNRDARRRVEASPLLRSLVEAAIWAADRSGGLVTSADPAACWREFHVDDGAGVIERPPGLAFDPGCIGKGFAADAVACQLQGYGFYAVDCGGDLRIGGTSAQWTRYYVNITNPLTGQTAYLLDTSPGAVATSRFDHHRLGLVSATALAPTVLEAEVLAKMALLLGAEGARNVLKPWGGVTIDHGGEVERHGPLAHKRVPPQYRTAA